MPKVLHVIDTTGPGGAETVFVQLAAGLRDASIDSVTTLRGEGWVANALRKQGLEPVFLDCKGSFNLRFLWSLFRLVRRERIDLVQSHLLGSNVYCALLGMLTGIPVIGIFHGVVDIAPGERFARQKAWILRRGLARVVAVCEGLRDSIASRGLLDVNNTEVIYNGIHLQRYERTRSDRIRRQLGLDDNAVIAGCLGNVRPAKAYDVLIESLPAVIQRYPQFHVAIAGDVPGQLGAELRQLAEQRGVSEHIHFLGFCDDSAEFLSNLDFFVMPSRSEGFPVSLIEALAADLPILATRCVGTLEILEHRKTGWLIPIEDSAALSDGLLRMVSDDGELPDWSQQRAAAAAFSMDAMLARYRALYAACSPAFQTD